MHSGTAKRDMYVRPPKDFKARGKLWKPFRLSYGIAEAGGNGYVPLNTE